MPCGVFWLSPDIRVAPLSNLGAVTRELVAGQGHRLTAVLRNRGDLAVPAAKVEFYLVNPSLGFDRRYARFLGVAQDRVEAHGAAEIGLDWRVPPDLAGHYCLFARAFAFAPRDLPLDDYALDPTIDRHVAQQNLTIIGGGQMLMLDLIHLPNARDMIELVPMTTTDLRQMRLEAASALRPVGGRIAAGMLGGFGFELLPDRESPVRYATEPLKAGVMVVSQSDKGPSTREQAGLVKQLHALLAQVAAGHGGGAELGKISAEYRALSRTQLRAQLRLTIPRAELKPDQAVAFHLRRTDQLTGRVTGGIALMVTAG